MLRRRRKGAKVDAPEGSFRAVAESAIDAIVSADITGTIIYVNPAAERMFGYRATELFGLNLTVLIPERLHAAHRSGLARVVSGGERRVIGERLELAAVRKNGEEFPVSLSLAEWRVGEEVFFTGTISDISARLAAEQSTRELAEIVDRSVEAVVSWKVNGEVTRWNRGAERLYGYSAEEMIGSPLSTLTPPGGQGQLAEIIGLVQADGMLSDYEADRVRKDGTQIVVALTGSGEYDETGKLTGISTIARDITARKAAERKLAVSSRHFELIEDLVATCGYDGYFKQLNGAWESSLGWTPAQLLPNPFIEIVNPPDRAAVEAEVARLAAGATTSEFKFQVIAADGSLIWTEWSASPDSDGPLFHCVGRVIQGRVEIEEALAAERRQLADAQQIALVGSWELDLATGERTWSEQQHRNHGFEPGPDAPSREAVRARIHPADREAIARQMDEVARDPVPFTAEYRVLLPDAGVREIVIEGRPIQEEDGRMRLMGTSRDVTAERDAERLKDEFIGLVSHELRTPLTSIIGYTELLAEIESPNLTEQGRHFLEVIERNSRRELELVADLLTLTKITAGTFAIERSRADIGEIATASIEAAGPEAAKAGVELSLDLDDAPVITGDPDRLAQVVENLVFNAIKFTPGGGRVAIRVSSTDDDAVIEVADTGIGIPADELPRLFERMFRAVEAERRHIQGTGLGLTIVKAIVDAHGGAVAVESEPGRGATFRVELPLAAVNAAALVRGAADSL